MPLSITPTTRATGVVVLMLRGSLRRADTTAFASTVAQMLRNHRPARMEVDLSGLLELEPGAGEAVVAVLHTVSREGTEILLIHAPLTIRQQLQAIGGRPFI